MAQCLHIESASLLQTHRARALQIRIDFNVGFVVPTIMTSLQPGSHESSQKVSPAHKDDRYPLQKNAMMAP